MTDRLTGHVLICSQPMPDKASWPRAEIRAALKTPILTAGPFSTPEARAAQDQFREAFEETLHYENLPSMKKEDGSAPMLDPDNGLPAWMNARDEERLQAIHAHFDRHMFLGSDVEAATRAVVEEADEAALLVRRDQLYDRFERLKKEHARLRTQIADRVAQRFIVAYIRFHELSGTALETAATKAGRESVFAPEVIEAFDDLAYLQAQMGRVWVADAVVDEAWTASTNEMLGPQATDVTGVSASEGGSSSRGAASPEELTVPVGTYRRRIWALARILPDADDVTSAPGLAKRALALLRDCGSPDNVQPVSFVQYVKGRLADKYGAPDRFDVQTLKTRIRDEQRALDL